MNEDTFTSRLDTADLDLVLPICARFDVDPVSSDAAEEFFHSLIFSARAGGESLPVAVERALASEFRSFTKRPAWLQNPDWQFDAGKPMHFVGQIDCPPASGTFHDDASFYVFWSPISGITKTVLQVA